MEYGSCFCTGACKQLGYCPNMRPRPTWGWDLKDSTITDKLEIIDKGGLREQLSVKLGPEKGEQWAVKYKHGSTLMDVKVEEITNKTVVLREVNKVAAHSSRYKREDIEFVEKLKEKQ